MPNFHIGFLSFVVDKLTRFLIMKTMCEKDLDLSSPTDPHRRQILV